MDPLESAILQLNGRLKVGGHRCSVEQRGGSLTLRATLPDRHDPTARHRQRVSLRLPANLSSLLEAERKAIELSYQLQTRSFAWDLWEGDPAAEAITVDRFREVAQRLYAKRFTTQSSWEKKWRPALNKLPPSGAITEATVLRVLRKLPEGSAGRRDTASVYAQVCRAVGIPTDNILAAGRGYTAANLQPRDIPSDEQIEAYHQQLALPHWRWMYGMCATYGLRPHEVVEAELDDEGNCIVSDDTKTGHHIAWPVHKRWFDLFDLGTIHRPSQGKETIAKVANDYMHDRGPLPWGLYVLRHAYAIRLITKGIPADLGCQLMGHSLEIHTRTYRRWLQHQKLTQLRKQYDL